MSDEADTGADPEPDATAESPENDSPDRPMSTNTTDTTDAADATAASDPATTDSTDDQTEHDDGTGTGVDLVRYARYALLGGLTLLALVATLRFYFAASNAIDIWVARQYRPLFQAAFNLVVLLVATVGISWELRKVAA